MKIIFTKEEIADFLKRECEVMVGSYHCGDAEYTVEGMSYQSDITISIELKEPVNTPMDESDIIDTLDQPEEVESLDELERELKAFDPDPDGTEDYFEEARAKLNA